MSKLLNTSVVRVHSCDSSSDYLLKAHTFILWKLSFCFVFLVQRFYESFDKQMERSQA